MIPTEKAEIKGLTVLLTIFFNSASLITLDALPSGARFNQEDFIHTMLLDIIEARRRLFHRFCRREFMCRWTIP
jgi:hypothetical protein